MTATQQDTATRPCEHSCETQTTEVTAPPRAVGAALPAQVHGDKCANLVIWLMCCLISACYSQCRSAFPSPMFQVTELRLGAVVPLPSSRRYPQSPSPPETGLSCLVSQAHLRSRPRDPVVPAAGGAIGTSRAFALGHGDRAPVSLLDRTDPETSWHRDDGRTPPSLRRADQGRLLDCVVRWGNLTEGKIRAYLGEVLEAVRYLHNCRIAHLDLKVSGAPGAGKRAVSEHRGHSQLVL